MKVDWTTVAAVAGAVTGAVGLLFTARSAIGRTVNISRLVQLLAMRDQVPDDVTWVRSRINAEVERTARRLPPKPSPAQIPTTGIYGAERPVPWALSWAALVVAAASALTGIYATDGKGGRFAGLFFAGVLCLTAWLAPADRVARIRQRRRALRRHDVVEPSTRETLG